MSTPPHAIRVLLFARFADLLGRESLEIDPAQARSVTAVLQYIRGLPGGERIPESPLVAVNLVQVHGDQALAPGDEVALLPPLSGG